MNYQGEMQANNTADGRPGSPNAPPAAGDHSHRVERMQVWPEQPLGQITVDPQSELGGASIWLVPFHFHSPFQLKRAQLYRITASTAGGILRAAIYDRDGMLVRSLGAFARDGTGVVAVAYSPVEEIRAGAYFFAWYVQNAALATAGTLDAWPRTNRANPLHGFVAHPNGTGQATMPDYLDVRSLTAQSVLVPLIVLSEWP